jgi:arabinan endo-1,5-alpha-L-arabinosidase
MRQVFNRHSRTVRRVVFGPLVVLALLASGCSDDSSDSSGSSSGSLSSTTAETPTTAPAPSAPAATGPDAIVGLNGDIQPAHDPDIARDGAWYYVFETGDGIPIKRSANLVDWEAAGSVFNGRKPAWIDEFEWSEPGNGLGAPDIEFFGGRWHLYYHAHEFATNNAVTGHASNLTLDRADPDYEWVDDGLIMSSDTSVDYSVLDANAVVDPDGTPWMSFGSFWTGIQLVELDPTTGAPLADAPFHLLAARDPWYEGVEASSMAYRGGYWYLFVSWGFCCQGVDTQYELRVGRSRDIEGPFEDVAGRPMLNNGGSLLLGAYGRVRGPGSGDVLVTEEDSLLVHHWYDAENDGETTLGVRPLLWSSDGWPIAADPGFVPAAGELDDESLVGTWTLSEYNEGPSVTIEFASGGVLAGGFGTWEFDAGSATIEVMLEKPCRPMKGTNHTLIVGSDLNSGFGYSDAAAALRLEAAPGESSGC